MNGIRKLGFSNWRRRGKKGSARNCRVNKERQGLVVDTSTIWNISRKLNWVRGVDKRGSGPVQHRG